MQIGQPIEADELFDNHTDDETDDESLAQALRRVEEAVSRLMASRNS